MSETGKAVFLSYASQDAEAAKCICDALRAAGVEVWFDLNELVGGDAWDQKIRKQIRECALFIPILSKTTQGRREAYFRLEWKLADERTHLMAKGTPFLLPISIDETSDRDALVPDSFLAVQWTKAPAGETPPAFGARMKKILSGDVGRDLRIPPFEGQAGFGNASLQKSAPVPKWKRSVLASAAIVIAVLAVTLIKRNGGERPAVSSTFTVAPVPPPVQLTEARQLVAKARGLFEALDSSRDDYKLAEELIAQAKLKDANDAEVSGAEAQLDGRYIARGWDPSDSRREAARAASQRAIRLDPQSFEARFAAALLLGNTGREGEDKERQLRELRRERPTDQRVLRALATTLDRQPGRLEEAFALEDESAALPGGDPLALYNKSLSCWFSGRTAEADAAIQASIAQQPFTGALLISGWYQTVLLGDFDGARATLDRIAPAQLVEDRAAFFAYTVEMMARRPNAALVRLAAVPRDWINDSWYRGPKGLLTGDALQLDGRREAAALEWRAALRLVDERLGTNPKDGPLRFHRVGLLVRLGEREEAARQFTVVLQITGFDLASGKPVPSWVSQACALLGRKAEAIEQIRRGLKRERHAVDYTAATLRLDPIWDPLRSEAEFAGLIAEAESIERAAATSVTQKTEDRGPSSAKATDGAQGSEVSRPIDQKSVAVLAFANLSDDKANEYFSDGISEELLNVLAKIPGLKVAARTSAFSFKGRNATVQEIGRTLGVATLVEGSVRKAGNSVRITARLSRAATGEQLWSESYTRELQDVFAVQSELAETIVGQLRGQLDGKAREEIRAQVQAAAELGGTRNVEAHELYLQGLYFLNQLGSENLTRAVEKFQQAVALDPQFALAWALLSRAGALVSGFGLTKEEVAEGAALAREAARRALAAEPKLALAHLVQSQIGATGDFDWNGAANAIRRAQTLTPNDANVIYSSSTIAYFRGRPEQAIELGRQAAALDPVNPLVRMTLLRALESLRRFPEAENEARRFTELSPTNAWAHTAHGRILVHEGKFDAAVAEAERGPVEWARLQVLAMARWGQGKTAESDAALKQLIALAHDVAAFQVAQVYAYRHDNDQAFAWLDRALVLRDSGLAWMKSDLTLRTLHDDPRWDAFLRKIGLADDQLK